MPSSTVRRLLAAGTPLVTPLLALGFNLALIPLLKFESPFPAFTAAVLLSAWLGGAKGGLLATAVSLIAPTLFFQIGGDLQVSPAGHSLRLSMFFVEGTLIGLSTAAQVPTSPSPFPLAQRLLLRAPYLERERYYYE